MDGTVRLSDLIGRHVVAADGSRLGRIADLAVDHGDRYPRVTALAIRSGRRITVRPWRAVRGLGPPVVVDPSVGACRAGLYLARDLLDAQVVALDRLGAWERLGVGSSSDRRLDRIGRLSRGQACTSMGPGAVAVARVARGSPL